MKKLLSLLGAVSVFVSTSTSVVACNQVKDLDLLNETSQDAISKLLSQYSKTLYLNQNTLSTDNKTHYSSSSYMKNIVKNQYLGKLGLTEFDSSLGVVSTTTFDDLASKYFDVDSLLSDEVSFSTDLYQGEVLDPKFNQDSLAVTLRVFVPLILGMLSDPEQLKILLPAVSGILTDEILTSLKEVATTDNLKLFEVAMGTKIYENMDYQTTLDSSVIGLSNALDKMLNGNSSTSLGYLTKEEVKGNIKKANKTLASNIYDLIKEEKTLQIDFNKNIDSIAEIVRFVRTLLIYIDQFTINEISENVLTMEQINSKREAAFDSNNNSIDVKTAFKKLEALTNDDDGIVMKNYLGILFLTNSKDFKVGSDYTGNDSDGLVGIVSELAQKEMGEEIEVTALVKVKINALIRSFFNAGVNSSYGGSLWNATMPVIPTAINKIPSPVKEIFEAIIKQNEWKSFSDDWVGYLWTNSNEELNFNLKDLLATPVDEIDFSRISDLIGDEKPVASSNTKFDQPKSFLAYYLNGKSIKDIIDQFNDAFEDVNASKINFTDMADLFNLLATDDKLQKALEENKNDLMSSLGWIKDSNAFEPGSPLEKLFDILDDLKEISAQLKIVINDWNAENNKLISSLKEEAKKIFEESKVVITRNGTNDFSFKVTYEKITNNFNIKASVVGSKIVITSISMT